MKYCIKVRMNKLNYTNVEPDTLKEQPLYEWFHLYEVQKQTKLIYAVTTQGVATCGAMSGRWHKTGC